MSRIAKRAGRQSDDRTAMEPAEDTTESAPIESAADHTVVEATMVEPSEDRAGRRRQPKRERR